MADVQGAPGDESLVWELIGSAVWAEGLAVGLPDDPQPRDVCHGSAVSGGCNQCRRRLTDRVTIKGMTAPAATMETAMELKAFYTRIIPWYKVWGGFSMTSDGLVCSCSEFTPAAHGLTPTQ